MLEAKNLCKVYNPKKGVPVKAIDNVSIKFPDTGMVFLLGKSGSGKSTLLNLLGGLDKYDSGEITIKGESTRNFKQQHFDSYRNTYVGFIFQEYNILEDFSVGANIALAIELQGRKATDDEINQILREVDLEGYGNRKPNELSGGQKQRVAIARALVKNPEIIMADEPTGALDSNTGRQVFDTLKKLSREKLVIIVSHDREFSELYADRIIELADGHIISDVELDREDANDYSTTDEKLSFEEDGIKVAEGYHLTVEDLEAINAYLDTQTKGSFITGKKHQTTSKRFKATDEKAITSFKNSGFKLIKSVLPMKNAFKIGASGLKYKKFRLVVTIILSCIAFGLFGLSDTFGAYNHVKVCTNSLYDSGVRILSYEKAVRHYYNGDDDFYWDSHNTKITEAEMQELSKQTGVQMHGAYIPNYVNMEFKEYIGEGAFDSKIEYNRGYAIYPEEFSAVMEMDEKTLADGKCSILAGTLPTAKTDIAISEIVYKTFELCGFRASTEADTEKITKYSDMVGKKIKLNDVEYNICGVIDTKFNLDRYIELATNIENPTNAQSLVRYALYSEYRYEYMYGFSGMLMVAPGMIDEFAKSEIICTDIDSYYAVSLDDNTLWIDNVAKLSNVNSDKIVWADGAKTSLAENEIILNGYFLETLGDINAILGKKITIEYYDSKKGELTNREATLVGYYGEAEKYPYSFIIMNDQAVSELTIQAKEGKYSCAIGRIPETKADIAKAVKFAYDETGDVKYVIQNGVTFELDSVNEVLKVMSRVFFFIGIGFAIFASIMLANFIGTSISYKKQEIGILRAIGSRSNDVFRIFFSESFIIAMINFVLSTIGVAVATIIINMVIRRFGILISVLTFGIRQIALLLVLSIAIAAIASFIPVKKIASKKPIDAIRNR